MSNVAFQVLRESRMVAESRYQRAREATVRACRQGAEQGRPTAEAVVKAFRSEAPHLLRQAAGTARTAVSALDRQLARLQAALPLSEEEAAYRPVPRMSTDPCADARPSGASDAPSKRDRVPRAHAADDAGKTRTA